MPETTYINEAPSGRFRRMLFGRQSEKFRDPFYLLILLGFISQGFFWENAIMPLMLTVLWFLLIHLSVKNYRINETTEILILMLALLVSIHFGRTAFMRSLSFGNGLLALQCMRMLRPLTTREKCLSAGVAIANIAVGSQMMLEYGFILVLAAALVLIIQTFHRLEAEACGFTEYRFSPGLKWKEFTFVFLAMVVFFVAFPRYRAFSSVTTNLAIGRNAPISPTLDPASGGMEGTGRLVMQVSGDDVGYLKTFTLDTYDGTRWSAGKHATAFRRNLRTAPREDLKYRKVNVKEITLLGGSLPTDGYPVSLRGNFFQDEYVSWQGSVRVSRYWPADNNIYEYWTDLKKIQEADDREISACIQNPGATARTSKFISDITGATAGELNKARALEKYLRDNFTYEIGTYDLNRMNTLEDFLFNEKKGHCERFASALALLFRQMGIPARVAIGFAPSEKNEIGGFYNIRDTDAHAWVEAYLPERGWMAFDATPVSDRLLQRLSSGFALTVRDWVEFLWYQKIVGFTSNDQVAMYKFTVEAIDVAAEKVSRNSGIALLIITSLLLAIGTTIIVKKYSADRKSRLESITYAEVYAEHFYRDLLRELASAGIRRSPFETPGEILQKAVSKIPLASLEMTFITDEFCRIRYGGYKPGEDLYDKVKKSLHAVKLAIRKRNI